MPTISIGSAPNRLGPLSWKNSRAAPGWNARVTICPPAVITPLVGEPTVAPVSALRKYVDREVMAAMREYFAYGQATAICPGIAALCHLRPGAVGVEQSATVVEHANTADVPLGNWPGK